jgi:RNA polymerase sigma-70 factor, ECF subfamily
MDEVLVARARQGDATAFRDLAVASYPRLYRVARGILRDPARAEDATQQALLDAWRYLARLREPARFEGWTYRLVVHACYAEARRCTRWLPEAAIRGPQEPRTQDEVGLVDDRDQLERAFARLSPEHRAVVVLHHLVGLPLVEVAETLGIRAGTAKSRLHRAMAEIRAAIEADDCVAAPRSFAQEARR